MKKLIRHVKCWNTWRKYNTNSPVHKFLVLIGFIKSPTFAMHSAWSDWEGPYEAMLKEVFKDG